jgi:hypothetical protein
MYSLYFILVVSDLILNQQQLIQNRGSNKYREQLTGKTLLGDN